MKEEEQRIAIATAAGWTGIIAEGLDMGPAGIEPGHLKAYMPIPLPDYLNDLNEVHEAEKVLTEQQCYVYHEKLGNMAAYWQPKDCAPNWIRHATAKQRAEAFLKALNLWID